MNIHDFIAQHTHKNYCEIVISPDGDIEYAEPSHLYKLIRITGESKDALNVKMPNRAAPMEWLVEYTGCCVCWYDYFIIPNGYTPIQINCIKELMRNGIMTSYIEGSITQEKTVCELLAKYEETGDRSYYEQIPERQTLKLWR
jgi:hypothetical protein